MRKLGALALVSFMPLLLNHGDVKKLLVALHDQLQPSKFENVSLLAHSRSIFLLFSCYLFEKCFLGARHVLYDLCL